MLQTVVGDWWDGDPRPGRRGWYQPEVPGSQALVGCWILENPKCTQKPLPPAAGPHPSVKEEGAEVVLTHVLCLPSVSASLLVCLSVVCLCSSVSLAPTGHSWVVCEHSDFRGRQWLVGSCEITNWLTYSGTQRVGSLYPIKQVGSSRHKCLRGVPVLGSTCPHICLCFPNLMLVSGHTVTSSSSCTSPQSFFPKLT